MDVTSLVAGLASVVSAIVGAVLAILYRDYRDQPRLRLQIDAVGRTRHPVKLPRELHDVLRPQGILKEWLKGTVQWDVLRAMQRNEFRMRELRDLRFLVPRFLDEFRDRLRQAEAMSDSMKTPKNPPTPEQSMTLARLRSYWQSAFQEDIFIAYSSKPQEVAAEAIANFSGDIQQYLWVIQAAERFALWLEQGLDPQAQPAHRIAAAPTDPESPRKPFIRIELLAVNSGRTETLITDKAVLLCDDVSVNLRHYEPDHGYEVYSGKFWRVKPTEVVEVVFSQDPDNTTLAQLGRLKDLMDGGQRQAHLEVVDYSGRKHRTASFLLRDELE